jgi:hypothetical protein
MVPFFHSPVSFHGIVEKKSVPFTSTLVLTTGPVAFDCEYSLVLATVTSQTIKGSDKAVEGNTFAFTVLQRNSMYNSNSEPCNQLRYQSGKKLPDFNVLREQDGDRRVNDFLILLSIQYTNV